MARSQAERVAVLQTQRDQIDDRITELTAQLAADVSDQGQSVAWGTLLAQYTDARDLLDKMIAKASGPVRVISWGRA